MNDSEILLKRINKRKRFLRKLLLKKLIKDVLERKFDNTPELLNNLYNNNSSRKQYLSPLDRSSYNYGYMNINEMGAGTPTIW